MTTGSRAATPDLLDEPFTPAMAAGAGLPRSALERYVREGAVVKVLRGVYVAAGRTLGPLERATALGLVLGRRQAAVGRTAAWLHGCEPDALLLGLDGSRGVPVEVRSIADLRDRSVRVGRIRAEPAADAAIGVASTAPPTAGLAVLDSLLRARAVTQRDLFARPCPGSVLETVARSDGRARSAAESVLRHHWLGARLPSPVPGLRVAGVRVALALPWQRFGVTVLPDPVPAAAGWTVVRVPGTQVLSAAPELARQHLEREFHQHLLRRVG